ncbi:MAG: DMT family transporter [Peptostreptococcus sp.]|uniref:DMT family transporter n=1 Tax=Peptostreptococcus sp. TaxID=1262 RepID=UPI002FC766E3
MSKKVKINLLSIGTVFFWSLAFPFSKVAMQHFSPYALGFLRVCIASVTLLIIGKFAGNRLPKVKDLGWLFLAGACGFGIYLFAFNRGIQTLSSASSSIVIALTPVMTAVAAHYLYGERINKLGWLMLFTAFSGVVIMMLWDGALSINTGMLWTLGAAVVFCAYNILNRKLSTMGYKAIEIVTYSMISAIIVLSPFSVQGAREIMSASPKYIAVLLMLGVLSSALAYYLWSLALSMTEKTSDVTNYSFLTPFVATLMGSIVLDEVPGMGTIIGGIVIIASIIVFSKKGKI